MPDRYFLSIAGVENSEREVTQEQFVAAERAAGFRPKPGLGPCATGGFSGGGVRGRIQPDVTRFAPREKP